MESAALKRDCGNEGYRHIIHISWVELHQEKKKKLFCFLGEHGDYKIGHRPLKEIRVKGVIIQYPLAFLSTTYGQTPVPLARKWKTKGSRVESNSSKRIWIYKEIWIILPSTFHLVCSTTFSRWCYITLWIFLSFQIWTLLTVSSSPSPPNAGF